MKTQIKYLFPCLGVVATRSRVLPVLMASFCLLLASLVNAASSAGTVMAWGDNSFDQTSISVGVGGVTAIAAGDAHIVALKSNGTVVVWGDNSYGQADVPVGLSGVTAVAAGGYHTVALKSNGTVVAWGAGTTSTTNFPEAGQSIVPAGLSGVIAIAAGGFHTMALKSNGTVVAWDVSIGASVPPGLSCKRRLKSAAGHLGDRAVQKCGIFINHEACIAI